MERGHVPDVGHGGSVALASWAAGPPQRSRFFGNIKLRKNEQLPLSAFRCPGCGYIELYAHAEEEED
jgi:hypothetical protein